MTMDVQPIELSPWIMVGLLVLLWIKLGKKSRGKITKQAEHAVANAAWITIKWISARLWALIVITTFAIKLRIGLRLALRLQPSRWNAMVESRRLKGLGRGWVSANASGINVRLHLGGSLRLPDVSRKVGQLESGLGVNHGTARVRKLSRADRADLQIVLRDPLAKPVPWKRPAGRVRLADLVRLSLTPFGDTIMISMKQRLGIFGTSGSGKSAMQRVLASHVIMSEDAMLDLWDLKLGTESQHFEGKAHRVITVDAALARTEWLIKEEFPRRSKIMTEVFQSSNWIESPEYPAMVVIIDEGNVITREFKQGQLERFFRAVEQGRALGVYFVWATQFPKATNLPTELRSQLNGIICLQMLRASESRVIFEDGVNDGWAPHRLKGKGWMLVWSDHHPIPEESRAVWLHEDDFRLIKPVGSLPPETGGVITSHAEPAPEDHKPSAADDVRTALASAEDPIGISELARRTGRSKSRVHSAIKKLTGNGSVIKDGAGYRLPVDEESK